MSVTDNEKMELQIEHVGKAFQLPEGDLEVLSDINLDVKSGEFISIVGASGCGKSTLVRMIAGLETNTKGKIYVEGKEVEKPSVKTGMIFQESRLFPWLSVEDNIAFGIHKKMSASERKELVHKYVDMIGLNGFEKALPKQLSGGMQQRVSIARTLINQPQLLLLDEPFGALDALTRINMQNEIMKIWEKERTTMLLITHDIDEAIFLSDRIVIMSNRPGVISKVIPVPMGKPRDRSSQDFINIRKKIYNHFFENTEIDIEYYI
ncbi:MAG: ABC transporter ATP-binding protein [Acetatifactor sp.]